MSCTYCFEHNCDGYHDAMSDFIVINDNYYCAYLNMFTPDPHKDIYCCHEAVINMHKKDYKPNMWFPMRQTPEIEIDFCLVGEYIWHKYYCDFAWKIKILHNGD